jgi:quercetin dioxygenase-like cupin family protein
MTPEEAEAQLRKEGFHTFTQEMDAGETLPPHAHPWIAAHIVIKGEMELIVKGKKMILKAGERYDVPAGVVHAAKAGPNGGTYTIGQK